MNLLSFALRRPISLLTMIVAAALAGLLALDRVSRDIFPDLGVPVLCVAQPYGSMDPAQIEGFIAPCRAATAAAELGLRFGLELPGDLGVGMLR
jgi:hypothetical protein